MFRTRRFPSVRTHHASPTADLDRVTERARQLANPSGLRIGT